MNRHAKVHCMGKTTNKVTSVSAGTSKTQKAVSGARASGTRKVISGPVAASARSRKADSIAMFIDIDNTFATATNVLESISILRTMGNIVYGKLYGYSDSSPTEFKEVILENKFETAGKLGFKTGNTSVVDTRLLFEAVEFTRKNKFKMVFIWTGIGELSPLFAALKELGCKTLTVNIPAFDCKNKFVDQVIKLYSPHSFINNKAVPHIDKIVVSPEPEAKTTTLPPVLSSISADIPENLFDNAPILPRKDGAPELGGLGIERKMDEKEVKQFYSELISDTVKNIEKQMDERSKLNEFDDLTDVFSTNRNESQDIEEEQEPEIAAPKTPKLSSYTQDLIDETQNTVDEKSAPASSDDFSDFGNL